MPLVAHTVSVSFANHPVLNNISFRVTPGRITGLNGPSGIGKSTLGRVLAGLQPTDTGDVLVDDVPIAQARGRVGMIFQSPRKAFDPRLRIGRTIPNHADNLPELMRTCALTPDLLTRFPSQVSDGQLQRAAAVRALAHQPDYLICDELSAMLDAATTATVMAAVRDFATAGGGVLLISHDHRLLHACADEVIAMEDLLQQTPA